MASGQVAAMYEKDPMPVLVVNRYGHAQYNEIFLNNPKIIKRSQAGVRFQKLLNGPGARPYIRAKTERNWYFQRFNLRPGELYLDTFELNFGAKHAGRVLVEPNTKGTNEGNKDWGFERWQRFVDFQPDLFLQVGPAGSRRLDGVMYVETPNFRLAAAVLAHSRAFVGTEGGLHHAAAALGRPAVVVFGGFVSPDITGYPTHTNIFTGEYACGSRFACSHCREAMAKITPEQVFEELRKIL